MRYLTIAACLTAAMALSACVADDLANQIAREEAKRVVNPILARRFPSVDVTPYTDCVIDNATAAEILRLAAAAATGPGPAETQLVLEIAGRRGTTDCFANVALGQFLI